MSQCVSLFCSVWSWSPVWEGLASILHSINLGPLGKPSYLIPFLHNSTWYSVNKKQLFHILFDWQQKIFHTIFSFSLSCYLSFRDNFWWHVSGQLLEMFYLKYVHYGILKLMVWLRRESGGKFRANWLYTYFCKLYT